MRPQGEPGLAVAGFTDRLENLVPQLEVSQARVLLLEWQLDLPGLERILKQVRLLSHPPSIIYFSGDPEERQHILEAGADYVIFKNVPPDELPPILNNIDLQPNNA